MKINENFLQFIWSKKLLKNQIFKCTKGLPIEIIDCGVWNHNQGPDFLLAKIKYQDIIFVGNIEIHVNTSDWISHKHDSQTEYHKIILHIVYDNDKNIDSLDSRNIPTIELKNYIDDALLMRYNKFHLDHNQFIPCEELISEIEIPLFFHEENLLKKLDSKRIEIQKELLQKKNNYEALLFSNLAYAFGLKVNAEIFKQIADSLDFSIINKIRQNPNALEALFFGIAGWLEEPKDEQSIIWKREYDYLKSKFKLSDINIQPKFSKLRPPNFPTLRLSHFAQLYAQEPHLFSKIKSAKDLESIKIIFKTIKTSSYWNQHYNFGKESADIIEKYVSSDFIELIIINAVLPLKYTFELEENEEAFETIIQFYKDLKPEKNHIIDNWKRLNIQSKNALETQSLLYQYKTYCLEKKCLNCSIGLKILKENE